MSSLVPITSASEITAWTTQQLRQEIARGLSLVAENLVRLAAVWQELERRGEDLSDLRRGIVRFLPAIACGELAAETVVAFSMRPSLIDLLRGVPLSEQKRLAGGGTVEVIDPSNPTTVQNLSLQSLTATAARVVIADGRVRTPAEQRVVFRAKPRKEHVRESRKFRPRYDPATGVVTIGRMKIRLSDLLAELSSATGPDHPPADIPEEYDVIRVRLTHEEAKRYRQLCRKVGLPEWEMGRKAMRAFGLI